MKTSGFNLKGLEHDPGNNVPTQNGSNVPFGQGISKGWQVMNKRAELGSVPFSEAEGKVFQTSVRCQNMDLCKVLIVIESQFMGDIFTEVLNEEPDITVVGCALNTKQALDIIQEHEVDVVLVSIQLSNENALELTRTIADVAPTIKVLVLGLSDNKHHVLKYVEAGAAGYILQDSSVSDLVEAVRLAKRGEAQVSTKVAAAILERLFKMTRVFSHVDTFILEDNKLTQREMEVLGFISQGLTNQEIASQLVVEVGTVKNHVHSIIKKLNVSNREEAATYLAFIKR